MDSFEADSIVWVNLGELYGWWPAIFQPKDFLKKNEKQFPDLEIQESTLKRDSEKPDFIEKPVCCYARFFDDDKFDVHTVRDPNDVKPYSCPDKLSIIRNGLKRFEGKPEKKQKGKRGRKKGKEEDGEKKKEGMFDLRAKLAQFYKDVELAEVMTDNSSKVADILLKYQIEGEVWATDEEGENVEEGVENPPAENLNPNLGSTKKKKTEPQNKTEKSKKKKR